MNDKRICLPLDGRKVESVLEVLDKCYRSHQGNLSADGYTRKVSETRCCPGLNQPAPAEIAHIAAT